MTTSPSERITRPRLERTAPVRTLFGGQETSPSPGAPPAATAPAGDGNVGRGVQLGYRVIEDYLRQGQDLARTMWTPGGGPVPPDPQQLATRMVQYASDFATSAMEYVQSTMASGGVPTPAPVGTAGPFDIGRAAAPAAAPAQPSASPLHPPVTPPTMITLDVESRKRARISVDIKPLSEGLSLVVHELRSGDGQRPRLTEVAIEGQQGGQGLLVKLRIPDQQPQGIYSGLIVDTQTNLPRGTMTVHLED